MNKNCAFLFLICRFDLPPNLFNIQLLAKISLFNTLSRLRDSTDIVCLAELCVPVYVTYIAQSLCLFTTFRIGSFINYVVVWVSFNFFIKYFLSQYSTIAVL